MLALNHIPRCTMVFCPIALFYLELIISFDAHINFLIHKYYHLNIISFEPRSLRTPVSQTHLFVEYTEVCIV